MQTFGWRLSQGIRITGQPSKYAGQQTDGNGLVCLRARYYDPASGRFLSRDSVFGSVGAPLTLNRYSYVENNPLAATDPSGHCSSKVCSYVLGASTGDGACPDGDDQCEASVQVETTDANSASAGGGAGGSIGDGVYRGGQYGKLPRLADGENHHIPANSVSPLSRYKGPAIQMDRGDHESTGSFRGGAAQDAYRAAQKALIDAGRVRDAVAMDVRNIRGIAGSRYNQAIKEMLSYAKSIGFLNK